MGKLTHRTHLQCTYFVTTRTWEGRDLFRVTENAEFLLECLLRYRNDGAYLLHEFVIMPNHLHLLITPGPECTLEKAMQLIKGGSSHEIHRRRENKLKIWQPGFHEWTVRGADDYDRKREYIRQNPVNLHLAKSPDEWIFGSACGRYALDPITEKLKSASGAEALSISVAPDVGAKASTP